MTARALTDPLLLATKAGAAASMAVLATQLFGLKDALSAGFVAVICVSPPPPMRGCAGDSSKSSAR